MSYPFEDLITKAEQLAKHLEQGRTKSAHKMMDDAPCKWGVNTSVFFVFSDYSMCHVSDDDTCTIVPPENLVDAMQSIVDSPEADGNVMSAVSLAISNILKHLGGGEHRDDLINLGNYIKEWAMENEHSKAFLFAKNFEPSCDLIQMIKNKDYGIVIGVHKENALFLFFDDCSMVIMNKELKQLEVLAPYVMAQVVVNSHPFDLKLFNDKTGVFEAHENLRPKSDLH